MWREFRQYKKESKPQPNYYNILKTIMESKEAHEDFYENLANDESMGYTSSDISMDEPEFEQDNAMENGDQYDWDEDSDDEISNSGDERITDATWNIYFELLQRIRTEELCTSMKDDNATAVYEIIERLEMTFKRRQPKSTY